MARENAIICSHLGFPSHLKILGCHGVKKVQKHAGELSIALQNLQQKLEIALPSVLTVFFNSPIFIW